MALAIGKKDATNAAIDSTMYPKTAPIAESAAELANLCKPNRVAPLDTPRGSCD